MFLQKKKLKTLIINRFASKVVLFCHNPNFGLMTKAKVL
jgi:hypothetical protein